MKSPAWECWVFSFANNFEKEYHVKASEAFAFFFAGAGSFGSGSLRSMRGSLTASAMKMRGDHKARQALRAPSGSCLCASPRTIK